MRCPHSQPIKLMKYLSILLYKNGSFSQGFSAFGRSARLKFQSAGIFLPAGSGCGAAAAGRTRRILWRAGREAAGAAAALARLPRGAGTAAVLMRFLAKNAME